MLSRRLKIHWTLWIILVIFVAAGVFVDDLSSAKSVTLELRPKVSIDITVFRPLSHALNLSLRFNRTEGQKRPELGDWRNVERGWRESRFLEFPEPGTPVKLLVRGEGNEVVYEALPAGAYGATTIGRDLVPFVDDGNPNRLPWSPHLALRQSLPSGYSTFNFSVLEVGPQLLGERVTLIVGGPVSLKSVSPGYGFLSWFMFWPLYAMVLLGYGVVLVWQTRRHGKRLGCNEKTARRRKC